MAKPPRAESPQRRKNERNPPDHVGRWERRSGLRLAVSQAGQRERERERDASATLTRPITDPPEAHGLSTALFPKETTRKTTPSQKRPGPSPKGPAEKFSVDHRDRPKPDLMSTRYPSWDTESLGGYTRHLISCQPRLPGEGREPHRAVRDPTERGGRPSGDPEQAPRLGHGGWAATDVFGHPARLGDQVAIGAGHRAVGEVEVVLDARADRAA
jgi:hypothetical protein